MREALPDGKRSATRTCDQHTSAHKSRHERSRGTNRTVARHVPNVGRLRLYAPTILVLFALSWSATTGVAQTQPVAIDVDGVESRFADNADVSIHYVAVGEGPLIVFIHGFPDFWYSWRYQMEALRHDYRVVAMDTRGYNHSDQPTEQADYAMANLVGDVMAVIAAEEREQAVVVGHDWGGMIAWNVALSHPEIVSHLMIVNLPHPNGLTRELATNEAQQANSQYARNFQQADSENQLSAQGFAQFLGNDDLSRALYLEAFERSSFSAMMNYYRENYPREPYQSSNIEQPLTMPVLQFHGLKDTYLLSDGLNNTWDWIDADYTLVTLPRAGHWAHHERAEFVSQTMAMWLQLRME